MTVPATILGQRATDALQGIQQEQRIVEMENEIFLYDPEAAPLTLFTSMVSKRAVGNPEFKALEDELIPAVQLLSAAVADGVATTIPFTDTSWVFPNTLWRNQQTGEVIYIDSITDATDVVAQRGVGSTAAAAMTGALNLPLLFTTAMMGLLKVRW